MNGASAHASEVGSARSSAIPPYTLSCISTTPRTLRSAAIVTSRLPIRSRADVMEPIIALRPPFVKRKIG